jgi:hypothetical protein
MPGEWRDVLEHTANLHCTFSFQKTIDEHIRTHSEDHMRDFIDIYINEMRANENNPNGSPFSGSKNILHIFYIINHR